jgi:hypothetical protein
MTFPPAYPHQPIQPIGDDLFMARGSIRMNPILRISRNMAAVRAKGELTLINPIRLDAAGLRDLDALGQVRHVVRLGAAHGIDDPFYVDRYAAAFWSQEGGTMHPAPRIDHVLSEGGPLPFEGARLFCFRGARFPECAIVLTAGSGVLLTCDAVQTYADFSNSNLPARLALPFVGFSKSTLIGPIWLKAATPAGGTLRDEFARLLELPFDALLAAHGTFLATGAHEAVRNAIAKAFTASP